MPSNGKKSSSHSPMQQHLSQNSAAEATLALLTTDTWKLVSATLNSHLHVALLATATLLKIIKFFSLLTQSCIHFVFQSPPPPLKRKSKLFTKILYWSCEHLL